MMKWATGDGKPKKTLTIYNSGVIAGGSDQ